jgi:serine/threonine protein kinase
MSDRERVGQLVYDFLERRFHGELVSVEQVLDENPNLLALEPLLREAERSHHHYLGRTIADYELKGLIGRGGFGEVFLAESIIHKYRRALKIVPKQRFGELSGIKEYMRLIPPHPHLVAVHHVGEAGKRYFYYTMPLADNLLKSPTGRPTKYRAKTLASCLFSRSGNRGPLPPEQVVAIGCAVATGLRELHAKNLVHRDVKPANILCIGRTWQLGDVGLLNNLKSPADHSGTPAYWPPEGPTRPSKKADQYALGLTLFQAATGLDAMKAAGAVQNGRLTGLPGLRDILRQACAKDPEDRFQSIDAMLAQLNEVRDAVRVRLPKASSSATRWSSILRVFSSSFRLFGRKQKR